MKQKSTHAQAAAMVRARLKELNIKGRVTSDSYAGGNSIHATITDQPPKVFKMLNSYVDDFQMGHFDGMQDLYEYNNKNSDLPQVKYAFLNNEMSDEMRQAVWDYILANYAGMEGAPVDAKEAHMFTNKNFRANGSCLIHRLFSGTYGYEGFWESRNSEKAAA